MKKTSKRLARTAKKCAMVVGGNLLLAFLVAAFIQPYGFAASGSTGIGLVVSRLFGVDMALVVLALNVGLLLFGLLALGKAFFLSTAASSLLYPAFLALMQRVPGIGSLTSNPLLASIYAGTLLGAALGMVMRVGSSTGGTDVVNLVMHKWLHWPVSVCVWTTDILIIAAQAVFCTAEQVLYGVVLLVLESLVLNQVMLLGQSQVQLMVFTSRHEEVREALLHELSAGVTLFAVETGYKREDQKSVLCVIPPRKLYDARELIHTVDPEAFLTITQIREVRGQGFTVERWDSTDPKKPSKKR